MYFDTRICIVHCAMYTMRSQNSNSRLTSDETKPFSANGRVDYGDDVTELIYSSRKWAKSKNFAQVCWKKNISLAIWWFSLSISVHSIPSSTSSWIPSVVASGTVWMETRSNSQTTKKSHYSTRWMLARHGISTNIIDFPLARLSFEWSRNITISEMSIFYYIARLLSIWLIPLLD